MKQSDFLLILVVTIVSIFGANYYFSKRADNPERKSEAVSKPQNVTAKIATPDAEIFNHGAVNPTVEVFVGACVDIDQNGILDPAEKIECASPENREKPSGFASDNASVNFPSGPSEASNLLNPSDKPSGEAAPPEKNPAPENQPNPVPETPAENPGQPDMSPAENTEQQPNNSPENNHEPSSENPPATEQPLPVETPGA